MDKTVTAEKENLEKNNDGKETSKKYVGRKK